MDQLSPRFITISFAITMVAIVGTLAAGVAEDRAKIRALETAKCWEQVCFYSVPLGGGCGRVMCSTQPQPPAYDWPPGFLPYDRNH